MYYDYFKDVYQKGFFWAGMVIVLLLVILLGEIRSCNRPPAYLRNAFPNKTDEELREMEKLIDHVPGLREALESSQE